MEARITAAMALAALDTNTATLTIAVLREAMLNGDPRNRHWAAVYFSQIDADSLETLPVFVGSLTNRERNLRISAAYSLLRFGPKAKAAVPALVEMRNDSDTEVQQAVRAALRSIDPEAASKVGVK